MSVMGTGTAAAVAQTAHTAQKTARSQLKAGGDLDHARAAEQDQFIKKLTAASEADDPDAELPDHAAPGYEMLYDQPQEAEPRDSDADQSDSKTSEPEPLYRHIDIQA
jgi:hypothetical protein